MAIIQPLPTQANPNGTQYAEGFLTPKSMDTVQQCTFAPERVIPVIFLPGIMGSNLRMSAARQTQLKQKNNIAWRPDNKLSWAWPMRNKDADVRQMQLDPQATVVDIYDPKNNPTGNTKEDADDRHDNVSVSAQTPMLLGDPVTTKPRKSAAQKARARGWGEVMFNSYGVLLNRLEGRLNLAFMNSKLDPNWKDIIGVDPKKWQPSDKSTLAPLSEDDLKKVTTNCWYPVHALGYNWLNCNGEAAEAVAKRIEAIMADYTKQGYRCEKVIIVTHSMGGLVGRALCHPDYGNLQDKILGLVHGVMPAIGAAAAYRRMRGGFECGGITGKVLGDTGPRVTAVLGNAPGGLQLLPSDAYGNGWLRIVTRSDKVLKSLPEQGDPYKEIYSRADTWWGLLREEWINPANSARAGLDKTIEHLANAKKLHRKINTTYHPVSYAHYGCDPKRLAFQNVVWEVPDDLPADKLDSLHIVYDTLQGHVSLSPDADTPSIPTTSLLTSPQREALKSTFYAGIRLPAEPGDETVPMHSADAQSRSGKFKGIFRQTGYEHQDSFMDPDAIASTLYSIVRIAQEMKWTC